MAILAVLLHLPLFCECECWDTVREFLKNNFVFRGLFRCPPPPNVISGPYKAYFTICACAKAESWEELERSSERQRCCREAKNPACEGSELGRVKESKLGVIREGRRVEALQQTGWPSARACFPRSGSVRWISPFLTFFLWGMEGE